VSLQTVRCLGFCYAAPGLLDGTVPHAGPELAAKLTRGTEDAPPIPVAAITVTRARSVIESLWSRTRSGSLLARPSVPGVPLPRCNGERADLLLVSVQPAVLAHLRPLTPSVGTNDL
jgi:hypothetical protein